MRKDLGANANNEQQDKKMTAINLRKIKQLKLKLLLIMKTNKKSASNFEQNETATLKYQIQRIWL